MKTNCSKSFILALIILLAPLVILEFNIIDSFYLAFLSIYIFAIIFVFGVLLQCIKYFKSPVEYNISLVSGVGYNDYNLKHDKLKNPFTKMQSFLRVFLELITFKTLYLNIKFNKKLEYKRNIFLFMFSFLFHLSLFLIFIGHIRYFWLNTPKFLFYINFNKLVVATIFVIAILFLISRRLRKPLSIYTDGFDFLILFLLLNAAISGLVLYFNKINEFDVKTAFWFIVKLQNTSVLNKYFVWHLFEASLLIALIPYTKLKHCFALFLMPTLIFPNNARAKKHVNINNPEVKTKSYKDF